MTEMSDRHEELLQKALFEELNKEERRELDAQLSHSPELARKLEGLRRTAALAREVPQALAPEELTARITAALPRARRQESVHEALRQRCPYYFIIAGALHLLLGISLQSLLRTAEAVSQAPGWVLWQPDFAFATGFFFLLCGGLLLLQTPQAARISYGGLVVYIVFVTVNGLALQLQMPSSGILPGLLAFVGMGLTIGVMLGAMVQHYIDKDVEHEHAKRK